MRKLKIGDKVKVKTWKELINEFGAYDSNTIDCDKLFFVREMEYLCGQIIEVTEDNFEGTLIVLIDKNDEEWSLTSDMVYFLDEAVAELNYCESEISHKPELKIKKLREDAIIPTYATEGDSGLDLYTLDNIIIKARETVVIPTGIAIGLPVNHEGTVRPRSGISLNGLKGCTIKTNALGEIIKCQPYLRVQLGTVDNPYSGDVGIITYNQEEYDVFIPAKTKLAQLVISPVTYVRTTIVEELNETERGTNGFGSTGV